MENNKLLIGIQFIGRDAQGNVRYTDIELYVVRDITLFQLLKGIKYGMHKLSLQTGDQAALYHSCRVMFDRCIDEKQIQQGADGRAYYKSMVLTSFTDMRSRYLYQRDGKTMFCEEGLKQPICDLGFITSTKIIFDADGLADPAGAFDTSFLVDAFNPKVSETIFFPQYNISSRQLSEIDDTPVNIIPPSDPPQKPNRSLMSVVLPTLLSVGVMVVVRMLVMVGDNGGVGLSMVLLSAAMGIVGLVTTTINYCRQQTQYDNDLAAWRTQYEAYINGILDIINTRQHDAVEQMDSMHPDMLRLIQKDSDGIYSLSSNLYSHAVQDEDFLSFRLGVSDQVDNVFRIKGNDREVIYSRNCFEITKDSAGKERLRIYLDEELGEKAVNYPKMSSLTETIAETHRYMKHAPLMYSLKNKGALGIVDQHLNSDYSRSKMCISRMVFELCYYHSPEDLQFVVFFNETDDLNQIEDDILLYKFMPHFHGLFDDKSQFVFNKTSANVVLSNLLSIVNDRKNAVDRKQPHQKIPHIVVLIYDYHGLKEHAFAEYLPQVPEDGKPYSNDFGLSFVIAMKHKEHLPAYCDDIISFNGTRQILTPRSNLNCSKEFTYDAPLGGNGWKDFYEEYTRNVFYALRFFSAVYYAQIAQNGKVPSSVSLFELLGIISSIHAQIQKNWGLTNECEPQDITKTLKVAIGKTETDYAYLDLHEDADGPHMLVAGTTGSGKTETVLSLLLALCVQYRPDELNLLLVDMKGGGFTKRIGQLPHVVGTITDIDGDENGTSPEYMLRRFLEAMKAEIKYRKRQLNKLDVDNLDAYIRACRDIEKHITMKKAKGDVADEMREVARNHKLSHLILVVDEFTELKRFSNESDIDYMTEITTIARIGRSLGFHIALISQNIEGAITDDIRVNSRTRICLKVATAQASKDMIGSNLAASPYMPGKGRAYLLVGTGSRLEYFQSGYSGARLKEELPVEMTLVSKTGLYSTFYRSADNKNEELSSEAENVTQYEAVVQAIRNIYIRNKERISAPHQVFMKPLPKLIAMGPDNHVVNLSNVREE